MKKYASPEEIHVLKKKLKELKSEVILKEQEFKDGATKLFGLDKAKEKSKKSLALKESV